MRPADYLRRATAVATACVRRGWKPALLVLAGAALVFAALLSLYVSAQEELSAWHHADLDAEFTRRSHASDLAAYLAIEDRVFRQLGELVLDRVPEAEQSEFNRFTRGSRCDPERWERNWNRTFELKAEQPRAAVLLLHGMSDSPYSMRHLAAALHRAGATCLALRMPGHGTAPSGLTTVRWEDLAAAVRLAVRHLRGELPDGPLFLVGYSNGGALAIEYAFRAAADRGLPRVDRIAILSPMIGVTPAAALAVWQERAGRLLGIDKLKWNSITPEFDPFKYGSFAVNAGNQTYRLTKEIAERVDEIRGTGAWTRVPPVLALQSAADATVSANDLISVLMERLPENGSELVVFDINRATVGARLARHDPGPELLALLRAGRRPFRLGIVTNRSNSDFAVELREVAPGALEPVTTPLDLAWPREVFSLSHIALPFPATDPLYGDGSGAPSPGVQLGSLALRGERGVLRVSSAEMLRLRWNPFYPFLERRVLAFFGLADGAPDR